ncbi:MAG: riboflavin biosynthesis protein RibF [Rhodospirillales bacterium CG15_BIG_FIL_POST_REV_8_21_14_020_66_15]|nr:MAG: riboflavin biosynthesis protein RibF [Rhodospirillales bacterium CG15_BIG_FIL_POST_REV_8_21_14_020_66_15]
MRVFRHYQSVPADARGAVVAIGNFDGVHLGHRAVIGEAGAIAHATARPWAVLTFEPHPRAFFTPDTPPFRLTPFHAKARLIFAMGVDTIFVQQFNKAFSSLTAEDFIETVLVGGIGAGHVVCGYDFVFGKGRGGTCEMLLGFGKRLGFDFTAVRAQILDDGNGAGGAYSSTGVREALRAGDPKAAARILGRPFEIEGRVIPGDRRGRQIGFPTANLALGTYLRPARGVYAVRVRIGDDGDGPEFAGVANIGRRPTFAGEADLLEVFLFDFTGDLYGRRLGVRLIDFLRPEKKFDGIDQLKAQIAADSDQARRILSKMDP